MCKLTAFIYFIVFTVLCAFPQSDISTTQIRRVKVIDEVRYILLDNVKFNIYDSKGKLIKNPMISKINPTSNGKERFLGYNIFFLNGIDTLTIEGKLLQAVDHKPSADFYVMLYCGEKSGKRADLSH